MTLFDSMVDEYRRESEYDNINAVHEVMQQIALAGLERGGFFSHAAFYGGTCLRLLHGMKRFSEDMDFSLLEPDENFDFEKYFPTVVEEFKLAGKDVEIKLKHKGRPLSIESAFLKETSEVFDIGFITEKRNKVKIEVDIDPPPKFKTEMKVLEAPRNCLVRAYDLPGLFAGKVHAALFRSWKNRVKGRDWYDVAWYISKHVELDLEHLVERSRENAPSVDVSSYGALMDVFDKRIDSLDFDSARQDVIPYLHDKHEVDVWSCEFFHQLVHKIRIAKLP